MSRREFGFFSHFYINFIFQPALANRNLPSSFWDSTAYSKPSDYPKPAQPDISNTHLPAWNSNAFHSDPYSTYAAAAYNMSGSLATHGQNNSAFYPNTFASGASGNLVDPWSAAYAAAYASNSVHPNGYGGSNSSGEMPSRFGVAQNGLGSTSMQTAIPNQYQSAAANAYLLSRNYASGAMYGGGGCFCAMMYVESITQPATSTSDSVMIISSRPSQVFQRKNRLTGVNSLA